MAIDELREYGLVDMSEGEIRDFLENQRVGILGLSDDPAPYMVPISYGFDGGDRLYITFLSGSASRKVRLTEATATARFLVYSVDTMYNWESVLLSGRIDPVPESEWDEVVAVLEDVWRPEILETAALSGEVVLYTFEIEERSGVKHQGLPPSLDPDWSADR